MSLYQALVLLRFQGGSAGGAGSSSAPLPFSQLASHTGLEDGELRRTLLSLACGLKGTRVLRKEPHGPEVRDGDTFSFNADFESPRIRIKINAIQLKETRAEVEETHERVAADRVYQVDAALVRIMKARKTLTHQALLAEAFAQLRFPAKVRCRGAARKGARSECAPRMVFAHSEPVPRATPYVAPHPRARRPLTSRRALRVSLRETTWSATA